MSWARVGGTSLEQTGSATSISTTYSATSGNLLVVSVSWGTGNTSDFTSVTDGTNTYTIPATNGKVGDSGNGQGAGVAYCIAASSGSLTIQANFATSCTYRVITIDEYSGIDTSTPFDTSISNNPSGVASGTDTITSTNLTTAAANELLHGYCVCTSSLSVNLTPGSAFNDGILQNTGGLTTRTENRNCATAGSYAALFSTTSGSQTWIVLGLAFKEPGGGGGDTLMGQACL